MATTAPERPKWKELKPNRDVFVATLAHIEEFPEHHDQGPWRCGSSMCFGGWASQVVGFQWKTKRPSDQRVVIPIEVVPTGESSWEDPVSQVSPNGKLAVVDPNAAAMIALGINSARAYEHQGQEGRWLFDGTNSLNDLYEVSAKILGITPRTLRRKVKAYRKEHQLRDYVKKPKLLSKPLRWRRK